jgi:hypothetical protein
MADNSGQADIRGLDVDKAVKGFAEEANVMKKFLINSVTSAREIRWFQKTSGYLDSADTTAVTASQIANTAERARPIVVEQSWTRNTSYVRKYFVESPLISMEDIRDSDVDILLGNIRDLVRAVERQVDARILAQLAAASGVQTGASTQDGWDDLATGNPILDILTAKQAIRAYGYDPEGCIIVMNSIEHKHLLNFLISVKGSSIPSFASEKVGSGVVMGLLGCNVVVTENQASDTVIFFVPNQAATWKSFVPITSAVIDEVGIGKKIRVWEEGECIVHDPKAVYVLTDTIT